VSDDIQRRPQALIGAFVGVAVIIAAMVGLTVAGGSEGDDASGVAAEPVATTPAPAATTPAAAPSPTSATADAGFPSLPAGADPALAKKPTTRAGSGSVTKLTVKSLVKGKGATARAGQAITVNYVGVRYETGEEFDASWNRSEPFTFQLGAGNIIPGFEQGLIGVTVGSRVQLDIPANLAYGDNPSNGAPAGPLRFIVDVLAVQ
jgi:FKBP-type peptidyl-prolyl cis-trans isomerase